MVRCGDWYRSEYSCNHPTIDRPAIDIFGQCLSKVAAIVRHNWKLSYLGNGGYSGRPVINNWLPLCSYIRNIASENTWRPEIDLTALAREVFHHPEAFHWWNALLFISNLCGMRYNHSDFVRESRDINFRRFRRNFVTRVCAAHFTLNSTEDGLFY